MWKKKVEEVSRIFDNDGMLAGQLTGYSKRDGQVELAEAFTLAILKKRHLIAEAPTGCGKSMAYLIPATKAIVNKWDTKRVIIATANITLQEQLVMKDLPLVRGMLGREITRTDNQGAEKTEFAPTFALLKGLSNYLCSQKFSELEDTATHPELKKEIKDVIQPWIKTSKTGDVVELEKVPTYWNLYSTMAERCLRDECPFRGQCYGRRSQGQARAADIVVTNYHMLLLGYESLPPFDVLICDEAHALADIARQALGWTMTQKALNWAVERSYQLDTDDTPAYELKELSDAFWGRVRAFLGRDTVRPFKRLRDVPNVEELDEALGALSNCLAVEKMRLKDALGSVSVKKRKELELEIAKYTADMKRTKGLRKRIDELSRRIESKVFWAEEVELRNKRRILKIESRFIDVSEPLRKMFFAGGATTLLLSATMRTNKGFSFVMDEIGLKSETADTLLVSSPFDLHRQGMLINPKSMMTVPSPYAQQSEKDDYFEALTNHLNDFCRICDGRVLALFTSWGALNAVYSNFAVDVPTWKQGELSKQLLIRDFKQASDGVLFGVASFWEGVDIPGMDGLFIDKIPFPQPRDPLFEARSARCEKRGAHPFMELSVPIATLKLRQGVGRLIRTVDDSGMVLIADTRLHTKNYGTGIMKALPPFKRLKSIPTGGAR